MRHAFTARFAGLPRAFWALFAGVLVNRIGGVVEPFLALYFSHRGVSIATTGAFVSLAGAGSLVGQIIGGVLADRHGRRNVYVAGMVGSACAFVLLGAAHAIWLLALSGFIAGFALDFHRAASSALVHDLVPEEDRIRAYGLLFWILNLGFSIAATAAGFLAEHGYTWLFVADAATCLGCAAVLMRFVPRETRPQGHEKLPGSLGDVLRDRALLAFSLLTLVQASVYFQAFSTFPLAMRQDGLPASTYGWVIALNGVGIVIAQPLMLPHIARVRPNRALAAGYLLIGVGFGLTGLTTSAAAYALPLGIWTIGEILVNSVGPGIVAGLAPDNLRARYQGVWGTSFSLAFITGPLVGAAVLSSAGDRTLWVGCFVVNACAALGALGLRATRPLPAT